MGKIPEGIELVLASFENNKSVHFLILSDCIPENIAPANVTVIRTSLEQVARLASHKLGFQVNISEPYKLCDFYAAYGLIFEDYLHDYDFWGTTDLDVIFGDIPSFITPKILQSYDVITGHSDYVTGHFTLYKNTTAGKNLFKQSKDYKAIFLSPKTWGFEECGHQWMEFRTRKDPAQSCSRIDSMMHVIKRLQSKGALRVHFNPLVRERTLLHKTQWLLSWQNGKLYDVYENREIMYFHFHMMNPAFQIPGWTELPGTFYINPRGFFT